MFLLYAQDGRNNSGVEEEDTGYLDLAYLTGNTTCRVNSNNASCYSSIYFDHEYGLLTEAIVSYIVDNTHINVCIYINYIWDMNNT